MKRILLAAALLCAITFAVPASADVIFDNGGPADLGWYSTNLYGGVFAADDFVLAEGASTITDIHWWGVYDLGVTTDDFSIYIFSDSSGPGTLVASLSDLTVSRSDAGTNYPSGGPIYEYEVIVDPIALDPNVSYWLAIANTTSGSGWIWAGNNLTGNAYATGQDDLMGGWVQVGRELAFTLTNDGVVPEPASLLLMGFGLAGVAWRARKKRS